jgi:hypothetical protein
MTRSFLFSNPPSTGNLPFPTDEHLKAIELGIGFDGRQFQYHAYRYDKLSDAVDYAHLERSKLGFLPVYARRPVWSEKREPTEAEQRLMAEFAIAYDGKCFLAGGYRYERLDDALNYVRH